MEEPIGSFLKIQKRRALSSALKDFRCGCFVPDLTRFTELSCEGTRLSWHDKGKLIAFQNSIGS